MFCCCSPPHHYDSSRADNILGWIERLKALHQSISLEKEAACSGFIFLPPSFTLGSTPSVKQRTRTDFHGDSSPWNAAPKALISIKDIRLSWKGCGHWLDMSPKLNHIRAESERQQSLVVGRRVNTQRNSQFSGTLGFNYIRWFECDCWSWKCDEKSSRFLTKRWWQWGS